MVPRPLLFPFIVSGVSSVVVSVLAWVWHTAGPLALLQVGLQLANVVLAVAILDEFKRSPRRPTGSARNGEVGMEDWYGS
jgi:hypothetical protein